LGTPSISKENLIAIWVTQKVGYEVSPWYQHIYKYLKDNYVDVTLSICEQIRMKRLKYVIIDEILYKRSFNDILLRCLHNKEIDIALEHTHGRACGGHFNGRLIY